FSGDGFRSGRLRPTPPRSRSASLAGRSSDYDAIGYRYHVLVRDGRAVRRLKPRIHVLTVGVWACSLGHVQPRDPRGAQPCLVAGVRKSGLSGVKSEKFARQRGVFWRLEMSNAEL